MPYLRATMIGDTPGCKLSAAISRFCAAVQRRRRSRPVITSIRRLRLLVRSVVGASSAANATAITPSSSLKDDRWRDSHRVAQCAAATPLTNISLIDEIELGLEPHRIRGLLFKLKKTPQQIFTTTHSPVVVRELN